MQISEWTYTFQVDENQSFPLRRWSFSKRAIGWGLFRDYLEAMQNKENARMALLEQQVVILTLGTEDRAVTMADVINALGGMDKMTPAEGAARYDKLVRLIFDTEWPDYKASWPVPDEAEGENGDPPAAATA